MQSIGDRILSLRKELNLNQKELAKKVGITEASLSRYENNLREPKAEIIARISKALGCSTDYLLRRTDIKNQVLSAECTSNKENIKYKNYKEVEKKILKKLIEEGLIEENESIFEEALNQTVKYGIEAAVEILKLKKKYKKNQNT